MVFKKMCPIRNMKFERNNQMLAVHIQKEEYISAIMAKCMFIHLTWQVFALTPPLDVLMSSCKKANSHRMPSTKKRPAHLRRPRVMF